MTDFTLSDVLAFARTKPADERYDLCDSSRCALAQFGMETGRKELIGPSGTAVLYEWPELHGAVNPRMDGQYTACTFGHLVKRLEALIPAKPSQWLNPQTYVDADVGKLPA